MIGWLLQTVLHQLKQGKAHLKLRTTYGSEPLPVGRKRTR